MATPKHRHARTRSAPARPKRRMRLLRAIWRLEQTAERHWPFAAYALLTAATAAYIIGQLAKIVI